MSVIAHRPSGAVARPLKVLVPLIQEKLEAVENAGLDYQRETGELLREARTQVATGSWGPWLNRNFHLSARTARRYMQLSEIMDERQNGRGPAITSVADAIGDTTRKRKKRKARQPLLAAIEDVDVDAVAQEKQTRADEIKLHRELALELIDIGYKALATRLHPDRGGSRDAMTRLNRVRDELKDVAETRRYV